MGFILKIVFIYFLIKFLWSVSRGPIIRKLQRYIAGFIEKKMKDQTPPFESDNNYSSDNSKNYSKNKNPNDTFEAEYKVLKK
tara:strand:+ start:2476 stop:2721 length:246 start_codon:yes stop_codon:yes gene_type:complete